MIEGSGVPIIQLGKVVFDLSQHQLAVPRAARRARREVPPRGGSLAQRIGQEDDVIATLDHVTGVAWNRTSSQRGAPLICVWSTRPAYSARRRCLEDWPGMRGVGGRR